VVDGRQIGVTPSIGIAWAAAGVDQPGELLRAADAAMDRAKARPGFAYEVFEHDMHSTAVDHLDVHGRLPDAIARDELLLHWQPQVDLRCGRTVGFEALVRWDHPERGVLPPAAFVPVAEASGLIGALGDWVIDAACRQIAEWDAERAGPLPRVSLNVSPRQLDDDAVVESVRRSTARFGIDPSLLTIELTETAMPAPEARTAEVAQALRDLGCVLSLDDFGTGYASLGVLTELPLQEVKIDRTFVTGMLQDDSKRRIVGAVAQLAQSLGLQAVAEGIEERAERDHLCRIGCGVGQGYAIAPPLPATEVEPWLALVGP
jgi:EAL domain-containing protein (putative c-di-GMP-specific phosphodiesterase class I)